ncbi:MAG: hypothetical protein LC104_03560 [Bacteroidales bacterium]|nr:hypothetical protein [Bacteroidales bacterium]
MPFAQLISLPSRWVVPVVSLVFLSASASRADTLNMVGVGQNGYGQFSGSLTVDSISATLATITVSLTNTTAPHRGGYITGFAFNNPGTSTGGNMTGIIESPPGYSTTNSAFQAIGSSEFANSVVTHDGINAAPYGQFDLGAALGGNWSGGGNPHAGIGVGNAATFIFQVVGTNLANLTAQSIFHAVSETTTSGKDKKKQKPAPFVVRFRGGEEPCGWSDKAVGTVTPPIDPPCETPPCNDPPGEETPQPVPAPGGWVLGSCAIALGWRWRRGQAASR